MDKKTRAKLRYQYRKLNGLCVTCGMMLQEKLALVCLSCREKNKHSTNMRREIRAKKGLCVTCGKNPSQPFGQACLQCREKWRRRFCVKIKDSENCIRCALPKEDPLKRRCNRCLSYQKQHFSLELNTKVGRWINIVRKASGRVAKGFSKKQLNLTSKHFSWNHDDFKKAFPEFNCSGKNLDHIIPLACANLGLDQIDFDFGKLALKLENIQLLTCSENRAKAANLDRQIIARAKELRQQGRSGADLFHQLWAEFAWPQRQEG